MAAPASVRSMGTFRPYGIPASARLTTALEGDNNDLTFIARRQGLSGNVVSVEYVVDGTSTALTVDVTGSSIVVNVATDETDAATSTADDVKAAIEGEAEADALVSVANAPGSDGSGVVTAMAATNLSGGALRKLGRPR